MLLKASSSVPAENVTTYNSTGTTIQWFVKAGDVPRFMMRRFTIKSGGKIGVHIHPEEHEIYVLTGEVVLIGVDGAETVARAGDFIYMPPNEPHGYANRTKKDVQFLCVIPKL